MKDIFKNKKKLAMIVGGIVLLLAIIIILVIVLVKANGKNNVESLEDSLKSLGVEFYETKYYPTFENKEQLADFKDTGLNISITNLNVTLSISEEIKDKLNDRKCDFDNTKIVIYPKESYGEKDYTIEVELACEK